MNQDESLKCLNLSKIRFSEGDIEGALRLAIKAQRMFETPETREWLEKVKEQTSSEEGFSEVRHCQNVPENVKTKIPEVQTTTETSNTQTASYSPEQLKEVKEFLKRNKDDYYAVLGVEKGASLDELKKAYKKLALKFHPDKNQAPGADEAFKTLSVAFSVLSDEEKRANFDRFGAASSSNGGFAASPFGSSAFGRGGAFNFHESGEISPEELFNLFFNAAFAQQHNPHAQFHSPFGGPGQFFFSTNFHNAHAHQTQQRFRQARRQQSPGSENEEFLRRFIQFIPLIIVFLLSLISSWVFPGDSPSSSNSNNTDHLFSMNPSSKYRFPRTTRSKNIPYYATSTFQKYFEKLKETDFSSKLSRELASYENLIETNVIKELKKSCDLEGKQLEKLLKKARKDQIDEIKNGFKLKSCEKLKEYQ